jgi:hypothetical protein
VTSILDQDQNISELGLHSNNINNNSSHQLRVFSIGIGGRSNTRVYSKPPSITKFFIIGEYSTKNNRRKKETRKCDRNLFCVKGKNNKKYFISSVKHYFRITLKYNFYLRRIHCHRDANRSEA